MMRLVFMLILASAALSVRAQQDPIAAQYINTPMIINPAYAGFSHDLNLSAYYRKQWAGFAGSPQTLNASGHMSLQNNKMGAGVIVVEDKAGSNALTEITGTYGYHLPVSGTTTLSFGVQLGAINYRTDYSDLVINPNDPKFSTTSEWQPNFGAGLILSNDKYFVSVAAPKMLQPSTALGEQGLYRRSVNILGSYCFQITPRLRLKPYAMYRASSKAGSTFDVGANLLGDDSYVVGAFTRSLNSFGINGQIKLDELLRIGYAFELPSGKSAAAGFSTHEIQVIIRLQAATFHDIIGVRNF